MERLIVIGNPGNRRTTGLQQARTALGLPPAHVVSYLDLLQGRSLEELAEPRRGRDGSDSGSGVPLLRLDAPGELFAVERELIALGAPDRAGDSVSDRLLPYGHLPDPEPWSARTALAAEEQKGRLYHPSQWFRGFGRLLARLDKEAAGLWPGVKWQNAPRDIIQMFDKRQTSRVLKEAGVAVPRLLAPPESLPDYESLRETMLRLRMHRVFIKLAAGSGACGVIAYQLNPTTGAEQAVTTIGVERFRTRPPMFYNSMKLRRYTENKDIRLIVGWLLRHGAHVEQWIAKAAYGERAFDIRQLVVAGEACHRIARVSRTPITNLHLRSERMDVRELGLTDETIAGMEACAVKAAAAFPASAVAGIDVVVARGSLRAYAVDVNPFGDLLYRVLYNGLDTYTWEMKRLSELQLDACLGQDGP
ncbi:STM4014 family protein [Paenibacillus ginsengarvi]|uniref:ATP-grasp domain-containing protein n=1 Tax=Paenibacillus ginsengarvi TaxID=400777 RepID=A0A3B0BRF0_9BACL|nr:STM4014 family protein [Paenibacillus ginsengarvi]RKN75895.1 hypothetical protein D7M11_25665 [Paenibacillus ginsengarvi]